MVSFNNNLETILCLSTDEKPTENVPNGAMLAEMDTALTYIFDAANRLWKEWLGIDVILSRFRDVKTRLLLFRVFAEQTPLPDAELSIDGEVTVTDVTDGMTVNGVEPIRDVIRLNGTRYNVSDDE